VQVDVIVEKYSVNTLNKVKLKEQVDAITHSAKNRTQAAGVTGRTEDFEGPLSKVNPSTGKDENYYRFRIVLEKTKFRSDTAAAKCLEAAKKFVKRAAENRQWNFVGEASEIEEKQAAKDNRLPLKLPELTEERYKKYFGHIKERGAHIRLLYRTVQTYIETKGDERNHTLFFGEPAAAKTIMLKAFKQFIEEEEGLGVERITMVNATTLTKAGIEKWLLERAQIGLLPDILWINELEKTDGDNYGGLLGVMEDSAEIARLNARDGKVQAEARILIISDCNDANKVQSWNNGALWSRFNKRYPCVRPSKDTMREILLDKIRKRKRNGQKANEAWANVIVDYCYDKLRCNDPRVVAGMLDGGDDVLNGKYWQDIEEVKQAQTIYEEAKRSGVIKS
jgi:hypothetical protein